MSTEQPGIVWQPIAGTDAFKIIHEDWGVVAFKILRHDICRVKDTLLDGAAIYFLFSKSDRHVYVGQADRRNNGTGIVSRLVEHDMSKKENYRDKWDTALVVCGRNTEWDAATLKALEYVLYNKIPPNLRFNSTEPNKGSANLDDYAEKVRCIVKFVSECGSTVFENDTDSSIEELPHYDIVRENETKDLQKGKQRVPEYTTPKRVIEKMLDMLPEDVWRPDKTFLDPACKAGEFLYAVYNRLMKSPALVKAYPQEEQRREHILKHQIYGIALSKISFSKTMSKLEYEDAHVVTIDSYSNRLHEIINGKNNNTLVELMRNLGVPDMKFDVVISNPPFTEVTGGGDRRTMELRQ